MGFAGDITGRGGWGRELGEMGDFFVDPRGAGVDAFGDGAGGEGPGGFDYDGAVEVDGNGEGFALCDDELVGDDGGVGVVGGAGGGYGGRRRAGNARRGAGAAAGEV